MKVTPVDIAIIDRQLPGKDGADLIGELRKKRRHGSLPVVLLYLGFQKQLVGGLTQGSVK